MCCLTPFRSGEAKCRLLRPRRPSTAVDERERPTWRAYRRSFSTFAAGLSADVGNGELASARRGSRRRHDPDGSNAANPLNCCRRGVACYSSSVNSEGISSRGPVFASSSKRNVARPSMSSGRPFGSLLAIIRLRAWSASYPSGTIFVAVMVVARALSQSISWVSQSISSLMAFLQASSRLSASTTICWYMGTKYWRSITNLGIGFLLLDFPTPQPPPTSVSRGGDWSAGSEGLQPELGEAVLAGGLIGHVDRN